VTNYFAGPKSINRGQLLRQSFNGVRNNNVTHGKIKRNFVGQNQSATGCGGLGKGSMSIEKIKTEVKNLMSNYKSFEDGEMQQRLIEH
jgi:hypothetical protein